ncbi:hypothetical protein PR048_007796 [Dryococelus australis]|uniref:Uncharacterized protein n=1 Tax=Dryococelus australis TaxID=614101 RepID=A0ABQ9HW51_9NEOP|nr:hypothetical protein PR048_007796 [Dryococelus australis]
MPAAMHGEMLGNTRRSTRTIFESQDNQLLRMHSRQRSRRGQARVTERADQPGVGRNKRRPEGVATTRHRGGSQETATTRRGPRSSQLGGAQTSAERIIRAYAVYGGRGGIAVRLLASHIGEPGSIPGGVAPGFSHVGIVPYDFTGLRVFSGISYFSSPFSFRRCSIPRIASHSSSLKTSMLRSAQISSLIREARHLCLCLARRCPIFAVRRAYQRQAYCAGELPCARAVEIAGCGAEGRKSGNSVVGVGPQLASPWVLGKMFKFRWTAGPKSGSRWEPLSSLPFQARGAAQREPAELSAGPAAANRCRHGVARHSSSPSPLTRDPGPSDPPTPTPIKITLHNIRRWLTMAGYTHLHFVLARCPSPSVTLAYIGRVVQYFRLRLPTGGGGFCNCLSQGVIAMTILLWLSVRKCDQAGCSAKA